MSELYRVQVMRRDADKDSGSEHRALLDAAVERDAELLVKLYEQHLGKTLAYMIE